MDFGELERDPSKESEGVWIVYPQHSNGAEPAEFLIVSTLNKKYRKMMNVETRQRVHRRWLEDVDSQDELEIEAAAKELLRGWRGDVRLGGVRLEYNYKNAKRLLSIADFRMWLMSEAGRLENFQRKELESDLEALKSSAPLAPELRSP